MPIFDHPSENSWSSKDDENNVDVVITRTPKPDGSGGNDFEVRLTTPYVYGELGSRSMITGSARFFLTPTDKRVNLKKWLKYSTRLPSEVTTYSPTTGSIAYLAHPRCSGYDYAKREFILTKYSEIHKSTKRGVIADLTAIIDHLTKNGQVLGLHHVHYFYTLPDDDDIDDNDIDEILYPSTPPPTITVTADPTNANHMITMVWRSYDKDNWQAPEEDDHEVTIIHDNGGENGTALFSDLKDTEIFIGDKRKYVGVTEGSTL